MKNMGPGLVDTWIGQIKYPVSEVPTNHPQVTNHGLSRIEDTWRRGVGVYWNEIYL